jgi:hypothetical protein
MAPNDFSKSLSTAYQEAERRLRDVQADATRRVQDAMSATPGWQAASKAAAAHAVLVVGRYETESLLSELFRAHVDAGERNSEAVARQVREKFLAGLSAPGLALFEGSPAEAASLRPAALRHAAEFETWRDALAADIAERFRRELAHLSQGRPAVAGGSGPRLGGNRVITGFLLVTAAMSLCGLSWLDIARRAAGLF